ncbi:HipA N-terminal domain-containing protein [bacterium]|nr:HipA N-terminal domain-containing protein [bacterium]
MLEYLQRRFDWRRGVSKPVEPGILFRLFLGSLEVGTLRMEGAEWVFAYSGAFQNQSKVAPIIDFPHQDQEYRSNQLWPFFALRVPSLAQANVQEYLAKTQKAPDDARLMREFGRRSVANPFVLEPSRVH